MALAVLSRPKRMAAVPPMSAPKQKPAPGRRAVDWQPEFERPASLLRATPLPIAPVVQTKLKIGEPNDKFEQEADRVAEEVMRMPDSAVASVDAPGKSALPSIQRLCAECEAEEKIKPQRKPNSLQTFPLCSSGLYGPLESRFQFPNQASPVRRQHLEVETVQRQIVDEEEIQAKPILGRDMTASPCLHANLTSVRGRGGLPLPDTARRFFEPRFGHDFRQVRIHIDQQAAAAARALNARAFTLGRDIFFGAGQFAPSSGAGRRLLAHELVHTIQQSRGAAANARVVPTIQRTIGDRHDLRSDRFRGDTVLEAVFDNERTLHVGNTGEAVVKVQQALVDLGFPLPKFGADGVFGSETATAVREFQIAHNLVPDSVVGFRTIDQLDLAFARAVPQLGRCTNPVVPRPPGKTDQQMMEESNGASLVMTDTARQHLQKVRDKVAAGQMHKATPQDTLTLFHAQKFLFIHVGRRREFLDTVDKALAIYNDVVTKSVNLRRVHGPNPALSCVGCVPTSAVVGDPQGFINHCDLFFQRGPQCRRNLNLHERLHLVGIGPHTPSGTTPADALKAVDNLQELVKAIMSQPSEACSAGK